MNKAIVPGNSLDAYTAKTRLLDARPDRLDFRDVVYRPPLRSLPSAFPSDRDVGRFLAGYVAAGLILDQGSEGACTGFGLACVANYLLWTRHVEAGADTPFSPVSARMFYELAKRYDEWPGTDYDGSSCRGALKGWQKHGVCSSVSWPYTIDKLGVAKFAQPGAGWQWDAGQRPLGVYYRIDKASVVDMQSAIVNIGAVYVSGTVHDGWDALMAANGSAPVLPANHAALPTIGKPKDPKALGGHAFALVGFNERGFVVQNSWGVGWGASGFGVLTYADWVAHGCDAWACALGVRVVMRAASSAHGTDAAGDGLQPVAASRWRVASGRSLMQLAGGAALVEGNPADDPWPVNHRFECAAYQPWSTDEAYRHLLLMAGDGQLVVTDFTRASHDAAGMAQELIVDNVQAWVAARNGASKAVKVAVYADGGLTDEADTIRRVRMLGPLFEANGIYPLFVGWKAGVGATLNELMVDWSQKLFGGEPSAVAMAASGGPQSTRVGGMRPSAGSPSSGASSDARDRAIEALAHSMGRGVWREMKAGVAAALHQGACLGLLARGLSTLQTALQAQNKRLELHLSGHSAGAVTLGHLLDGLATASPSPTLRVHSCSLFAPACSIRFALAHFVKAADVGMLDMKRLHIDVLSDQNEKRSAMSPSPDQPGFGYGKSMLYLVSRALEDVRKMPLLGMERAFDLTYTNADQWGESESESIGNWKSVWPHARTATRGSLLSIVVKGRVAVTGDGEQWAAGHASFEHDIEVMGAMLTRVKGAALVGALERLDY